MPALSRFAAFSALSLLAATGCGSLFPQAPESAATEWGPGTNDLRKATALVRVTPPARLKAAFETAAARSDDPDVAAFLHMHAGGGFGSGFLMVHHGADGSAAFVVTNRHVIAESAEAEVSFADGTTYKACEVVYASSKYDLAVLALPESALRALGPGLRPAARPAADRLPVVATGYPGVGGRPSFQITDGKVSNASFTLPDLGLPETYVQHTAPIDPGSSGGPLTDETGGLVGVNVMLIRDRSSMFFAVPSAAVTETVRHAHSLATKKRSADWMTAELDKSCTALASELASNSKSGERLLGFVSNAAVADRGLESYALMQRTALASDLQHVFFRDPISAVRRSVFIRLGIRFSMGGGATGSCAALNAADAASIADGKYVRRAVATKNGGGVELLWTFEHGSWRVAGGDLIEASAFAPREPAREPSVAAAGTRTRAKAGK